MIESNKICEILEGINQDETYNACGWWETSFGATFGKERLKELLDYIELEKNDIGLKDINGKSIYADSSIVEFEFGTISNKKVKGYFKYSNYTLGYHIVLVDDRNRGRAFRFDAELMYDFKIIDTIQENKLGLIK